MVYSFVYSIVACCYHLLTHTVRVRAHTRFLLRSLQQCRCKGTKNDCASLGQNFGQKLWVSVIKLHLSSLNSIHVVVRKEEVEVKNTRQCCYLTLMLRGETHPLLFNTYIMWIHIQLKLWCQVTITHWTSSERETDKGCCEILLKDESPKSQIGIMVIFGTFSFLDSW